MDMTNAFTPPLLAPDLQRKKFELDRAAQMGRMLMEDGAQMPQGQMVSGHYVAPSWSQYVGQVLKSYLGGKAMSSIPGRMADLQQAQQNHDASMFGFNPSPQQLAQGLSGGEAQTFPMEQSGMPQQGGQDLAQGAGAVGGPSGYVSGDAAQPVMPLLFPNDPQRSMMAYQAMGPGAYFKQVAQQGGLTNEQKNLAFLPEAQRNALIMAPFLNDAGKDGVQNVMGPDGRVQAFAVPGYAGIQAANAGGIANAQEAAKAGYDLVDMPDGQGGTVKMPRSQAVQATSGQAPGGLGYTPSPAATNAAQKLNDDWISGSYRPVLDGATSAQDLIGSITALRNIPLQTGWGTEAKAAAANLLASLGVDNKNVLNYASNAQKFQSVAMDRLQTELMKQKGPQTEGDAQRAGKTFAKLENTPEANAFILALAQARANREMRRAEFYQDALPLARKNGDLTEVDRRWRKLQGSIWNDPILAPYRGEQ